MEGFVYLAILAAVYMLPALIAHHRRHRNRLAITWLNLLLGWTLIGWIISLVWACTADTEPAKERRPLMPSTSTIRNSARNAALKE